MEEVYPNNSGNNNAVEGPSKKKSPKLLIALIIIAILTVIGVGVSIWYWQGYSKQKINSEQKMSDLNKGSEAFYEQKQRSVGNCQFNDKDLCKFINNLNKVENISVEKTEYYSDGKTTRTKQIQGIKHSETVISNNNELYAMTIDICPYHYDYDKSDRKWWIRQFDSGAVPEPIDCSKSEKDSETLSKEGSEAFELVINDHGLDKTTFQKIGTETCGSLMCLKYQIFDIDWDHTRKYVWFDTKEHLPRKIIEYDRGTLMVNNKPEEYKVSEEAIISYDKINITEPSPVKHRAQIDCPSCIR